MNIDYNINLGKPSVKYLISALQKIVDDNPEINFHKVGVSLNNEYDFSQVEFHQWGHDDKLRVCIDIA